MAGSNPPPGPVQIGIPCSLYRGGTSRGVLLLSRDLPDSRGMIEPLLLAIFGSPDGRQIDGVGGGNSQSSKAMLVGGPAGPDHDVLMTFAQVAVNQRKVDWGGNCGNMTTAVGPFAIESGLVAAVEPFTAVRIRSANTGAHVVVHVPVLNGQIVTAGDFSIPGVPGTGARIDVEWLEPGGSGSGRLLPTARPRDTLRLADGGTIDVSIVDAVNPVVFCSAASLGLTGVELPAELEARPKALARLEEVRGIVAEMLGLARSRRDATRVSPGLPKVAMVAPAADYLTTGGALVKSAEHDLHTRMMSMQTPHRSIAVSGGICAAAAAAIEGSVVHACLNGPASRDRPFRIAHPYGVMDFSLNITMASGETHLHSARVGRTARRIMSGAAYVPASLLPAADPSPAGRSR